MQRKMSKRKENERNNFNNFMLTTSKTRTMKGGEYPASLPKNPFAKPGLPFKGSLIKISRTNYFFLVYPGGGWNGPSEGYFLGNS
jgi:hypothetical protein